LQRELSREASAQETTLFRSDSTATKAVRAYFRIVGSDYVKKK